MGAAPDGAHQVVGGPGHDVVDLGHAPPGSRQQLDGVGGDGAPERATAVGAPPWARRRRRGGQRQHRGRRPDRLAPWQDALVGGLGADTLRGLAGDDTLRGTDGVQGQRPARRRRRHRRLPPTRSTCSRRATTLPAVPHPDADRLGPRGCSPAARADVAAHDGARVTRPRLSPRDRSPRSALRRRDRRPDRARRASTARAGQSRRTASASASGPRAAAARAVPAGT